MKPDAVSVRAALARGDLIAAFSGASEALAAAIGDPELHYLLVLTLARLGETEEALRRYQAFRLADGDSVDSRALGARLKKDLAFACSGEGRERLLHEAAEEYAAVHRSAGGHFPLINAATLAALAGQSTIARERATQVLAELGVAVNEDYWALATRAEAQIILDDLEAAKATISAAVRTAGADAGSRTSTLRQLSQLLASDNSTSARAVLSMLRPPPVAHTCGHIFRADDPVEVLIRAEIVSVLERTDVSIAYGALAAGGDILLAEEIISRGGEFNAVLPFDLKDFVAQSVAPAGESWVDRFDACLQKSGSVTYASAMNFVGDEEQFAYGSRVAMGMAHLRAEHLLTKALQVAVWDGVPARGSAGTGADVRKWRSLGRETVVVAPGGADRAIVRRNATAAAGRRAAHAILFGDYAGFSKIAEPDLPAFWRGVMHRSASILADYADVVLCQNSWGDALYVVVEDISSAASLALELQRAFRQHLGPAVAGSVGMRVALHCGTMYRTYDPVIGRTNYFGGEVSRAARLEPVTPPGAVFVTEPFAALLAMEAPGRYRLGYVGRLALAKNYGELPIYRLDEAP